MTRRAIFSPTHTSAVAALALAWLATCAPIARGEASSTQPAAQTATGPATEPALPPTATEPATASPETAPADSRPAATPAAKPTPPPTSTTTAPATAPPATALAEPDTSPAKPDTVPAQADTSPAGDDALAIRSGDVVVFLGDELTDTPRPTTTNSFTMLVETFLAARYADLHPRYINVGWSGDTAARALLRLDRDVLSHEPSVVVVCLGLNDPEYRPFSDKRLAAFSDELAQIVSRCRDAGARVWLVSPPCVDENKGRKVRVHRGGRAGMTDLQAIGYNDVLAKYTAAIADVAAATDSGFADWFTASSKALERGRQKDPEFSLTTNGLNPSVRSHALGAATLLKAWNADAIEANIDLQWATGEASVAAPGHPTAAVAAAGINGGGQRRVRVERLPLPWPMAGGRAGIIGHDWQAAEMSRFILRIPDAPDNGVMLRIEWPAGPVAHDQPISAEQLRNGFNLTTTEALNAAPSITRLFTLIGTKNYYHYGTWRKLALSPPKEAELVEAHRQLIDAWKSYVAGTEALIRNQPRQFDVQLVLTEAVPVEQLPTNHVAPPPPPTADTTPEPAPDTAPAIAEPPEPTTQPSPETSDDVPATAPEAPPSDTATQPA